MYRQERLCFPHTVDDRMIPATRERVCPEVWMNGRLSYWAINGPDTTPLPSGQYTIPSLIFTDRLARWPRNYMFGALYDFRCTYYCSCTFWLHTTVRRNSSGSQGPIDMDIFLSAVSFIVPESSCVLRSQGLSQVLDSFSDDCRNPSITQRTALTNEVAARYSLYIQITVFT